jgi:tetratricopeptide (TPR) repeat protein
MTEESAERFRQWFAQHGFNGFVRGMEESRKESAEQAARNERFLATLPSAARSLVPSEPYKLSQAEVADRAQQIAGQFDSRRAFVHACWRALGELASWDSQTRRAQEEFLVAVLETATTPELADALAALPPNKAMPWLGAYQHFASADPRKHPPILTAVDNAWLAKLALRFFRDGPAEKFWVLSTLANHPGDATTAALLEIARSPGTAPLRPGGEESPYSCAPDIEALLALAKLHATEARLLIVEKLAASPSVKDRLVLEIALAHFDGPQTLRPEHLSCSVSGADTAAWNVISATPGFAPTIDDLVTFARSGCFAAREYATGKLRERGLRVISPDEDTDALLKDPNYAAAKTLPELDGVIDVLEVRAHDPNFAKHVERILGVLLHRRGELLLSSGEFEKAREDLTMLWGEEATKAADSTSHVLQSLGYLDAAGAALSRSSDRHPLIEPAAAYLERRAYLSFAKGEFEEAAEDFDASLRLDTSDKEHRYLFRLLALALAGKPDAEGMAKWDPNLRMPGIVFETDEDSLFWPDTGIRLLQDRISEAEVLRRIELSRGERNEDLCEAHFVFSILRRLKNDPQGEARELEAALATKAFTTQPYSLAYLRRSQLEAGENAAPDSAAPSP